MNELTTYEYLRDGIPHPPSIYRYDQSQGRYYARVAETDGTYNVVWFPSVTTIIRDTSSTPWHLIKWYAENGMEEAEALRDAAAEFGTAFHIYAAKYLTGAPIDLRSVDAEHGEKMVRDLVAFMTFVKDRNVKPLAVEMLLASDELTVAGTVDIVAELDWKGNRIVAVIDMKTSSGIYDEHYKQVEFYRQMWNETYGSWAPEDTGDVKPLFATHTFLIRPKDWTKAPSYELKNATDKCTPEEVHAIAKLWRLRNGEWTPKPRTTMSNDVAVMDGEIPQIITQNPNEMILERHLGRAIA